jgi:hypothetical protein
VGCNSNFEIAQLDNDSQELKVKEEIKQAFFVEGRFIPNAAMDLYLSSIKTKNVTVTVCQ